MEIIEKSPDSLYEKAAANIIETIRTVLEEKEHCLLGIVGGRAIPGLLAAIAQQNVALQGTIHVFWLDERVSPDKNFEQALPHLERLSSQLSIQWHPFVSMDRDGIARETERASGTIARLGGFDLVVLSAGEDGHIASLFPGHSALKESAHRYVLVTDSPKPPPMRVTASPGMILAARHAFLFFMGEKHDAYERFKDAAVSASECPAKLLTSIPLDVYVSLK